MPDRREPMARPAGARRKPGNRRLLWTLLALVGAIGGGLLLALGGIALLRGGRAASADASTGEPSAAVLAVSATNAPRLSSPTPLPSVTLPPSLPAGVTPSPTVYLTATSVPAPADLDPPVAPPGEAAFGEFEIGGAVDGRIRHADEMIESGMTWVAYELAWEPDLDASAAQALIAEGRQKGFKVLLSVVGARQRPQTIDYPAFIEFLRGVAYYGPDAIEVWPGPNVVTRWPAGELSGETYVRQMLAPAYNAIKAVNSNIMVISGAPIPTLGESEDTFCTGATCSDTVFVDQMMRAGAATYSDCLGVEYTQGATAPSATSGHPAAQPGHNDGWYFGEVLDAYVKTGDHRVCFTRLGYLSGQSYGGVPAAYDWARGTGAVDQGRWLAEAAVISAERGAVRLMIVWNVDYLTWEDADPRAGYAIVRPDNGCPACDALGALIP